MEKHVFLSFALLLCSLSISWTHEAKDFDDSILYKIEFDKLDFENPELRSNVRTFYTHEQEMYDCAIPIVPDAKEDKKPGDAEISALTILRPMFSANSCSYRIEAYWTYEICHGFHIRQYHEEREGKSIKFQEYYLGKWSDEKTKHLSQTLEEQSKAGIKHKTTKIDGIKYPYFEMEMTDGTLCDIIDEPRTTKIRYVCYPHGKNEIYSFKETSSCNYEAIVLTSLLCIDSGFHPEESKEVVIKCMNSNSVETHKPLSMLRLELQELQMDDSDLPISKDATAGAGGIGAVSTNQPSNVERYLFVNKFGSEVDKLMQELMEGVGLERSGSIENVIKIVPPPPPPQLHIANIEALKELNSGLHCITGGTGWWKLEFCHGTHVRQFHENGKSEDQIMLGYFNEAAQRQWLQSNPDKAFRQHRSNAIWHHYEAGTHCDRTGKSREVDVKLTCAAAPMSGTMYLLEPRTCQYILVVEMAVVCDLMKITNEFGLIDEEKFQKILNHNSKSKESTKNESPANHRSDNQNNELETDETTAAKRNPTGTTGVVSRLPTLVDILN